MIELDDTKREMLPLTDEQFKDILVQIADNVDLSSNNAYEATEESFIFHKKFTEELSEDLAGGFEIIVEAMKNERDEIGISINKMIIFETEDEWLDAYKRIKDSKKS